MFILIIFEAEVKEKISKTLGVKHSNFPQASYGKGRILPMHANVNSPDQFNSFINHIKSSN